MSERHVSAIDPLLAIRWPIRGYSSAVEHSTADRQVPCSNQGAPFFYFWIVSLLSLKNCVVWCGVVFCGDVMCLSYGDLIILISELVNSGWNSMVLIEESKCDSTSSRSSIITSTFIA